LLCGILLVRYTATIAWRTRNALGLDHLKDIGGVSDAAHPDNIIYDISPGGVSAGGFGHPKCLNTGDETLLPAVQ
jgi:hypothetical protein